MRMDLYPIRLQMFAEGADGGSAGNAGDAQGNVPVAGGQAAAQPKSAKGGKRPESQTIFGKQPETKPAEGQSAATTAQEPQKLSFEDLLKSDPEYKAAYDERVQTAINGRFKAAKQLEDDRAKLNPMLQLLGQKYGVKTDDPSKIDLDALAKAITEDDSYYEAEALEKGVSVESLKRLKAMERENTQLREQMQERQRQDANRQLYAQLTQQSEAAKAKYPDFDLDTEMRNPSFARMVLQAGVPVMTAYAAMHHDELMQGAVAQSAQAAQARMASTIQANAARPTENGLNAAPAVTHVVDPTKLTKEQRREIRARVNRGDQIIW